MNADTRKAEEVTLPDIGDFTEVEVIEVAVAEGDRVAADATLVVIETDKASMDVPAPFAGTVAAVVVSVGDKISAGDVIVRLSREEDGAGEEPPAAPEPTQRDPEGDDEEAAEETGGEEATAGTPKAQASAATADEDPDGAKDSERRGERPGKSPGAKPTSAAPRPDLERLGADLTAEVLVLGSGPGGYTAAFRCADLGKRTVLVERYETLGGVCLNVGCIPSKALLHAAEVIESAAAFKPHGIDFGAPQIDTDKLSAYKSSVVGKLTKGLDGLARQRKVEVVHGMGRFVGPNLVEVRTGERTQRIAFENAIIAAGSSATMIPGLPEDPRIMDSTDALKLEEIPSKLLVIGGGIIGLEMAAVYHALGSRVTVVELLDQLMPGCDPDLVRPLHKRIAARYEAILLGTKVTAVKAQKRRIRVELEGKDAPGSGLFDRVLVAVGRRPNGRELGLESAGVKVDEAGFIPVDDQQRTNVPHLFAIGDIVGQPMLAHKATHEAKVAAEVIAGGKSRFEPLGIPSVAYTDPEVAWVGLTETDARARGVEYERAVFPWAASGRALGLGREEGFTKLLFDAESGRLVGAGIVGVHAGDLIAEATLAIEMGSDAEDIGLTIHPHPTLSETINFASEIITGSITDLYLPKRGQKPSGTGK